MLWICIWNKARNGAKALLDSNARKQECVFEVELVNGVFQSNYTNPSEEAMMNSLEISLNKTQHDQCSCRKGSYTRHNQCLIQQILALNLGLVT